MLTMEAVELQHQQERAVNGVFQQQQQQHGENGVTNSTCATSSRKRKRPIVIADPFARIAASTTKSTTTNGVVNSSKSGRGSQAGWTYCPLCVPLSKKVFARGRGIASHLHAVHTPWKAPSKAERKRRRQLEERTRREAQKLVGETTVETPPNQIVKEAWDPTEKEMEEWNTKVLTIVQELEENPLVPPVDTTGNNKQSKHDPTMVGVDRNGKTAKSYKASLPPLLQAASDGNLKELRRILLGGDNDKNDNTLNELNRTDRHGSIAEHWAAGGGHLECLQFFLETRQGLEQSQNNNNSSPQRPTKLRRRDGKTSLHYAARNGHVHCIDYLLTTHHHAVDETSGDGTTPFHLACFGAHLEAMELLLERGANPRAANEWGCTAAHWLAMTKCPCGDTVRRVCCFLQSQGVCFVTAQSQGHSPLHKAAQRHNRHVIEWLAYGAGLTYTERQFLAKPDEGGYTPSDIWKNLGGDKLFGEWMKQEMGW